MDTSFNYKILVRSLSRKQLKLIFSENKVIHQLLLYPQEKWGYRYLHHWTPQADNNLCELVIFINNYFTNIFFEQMMEAISQKAGVFLTDQNSLQREGEKVALLSYSSDEVDKTYFSYESFVVCMNSWKEAILYEPSGVTLYRSGEHIWLTFEKLVGIEKALIKNSLKGYSVFVATPGFAECLAQFFVDEIMPLSVHSISMMLSSLHTLGKGSKVAWEVKDNTIKIFLSENPAVFCELTLNNLQSLVEQWMMYADAQYFRIFLEYKDSQWIISHSNSILDEKQGYEIYL